VSNPNLDCAVCNDKGLVLSGEEVVPCPRCNPDSGWEPGEYENMLREKAGRCGNPRGGGGRTCYLAAGHEGPHTFQCGA
jgi:hypothetical protein